VSAGKANVAATAARASPSCFGCGHIVDEEATKCLSQLDGCIVIRYQVFMTNLVLSLDLIKNQSGIIIGFKVLYPHFFSKLEANESGVVLGHIIGIGIH